MKRAFYIVILAGLCLLAVSLRLFAQAQPAPLRQLRIGLSGDSIIRWLTPSQGWHDDIILSHSGDSATIMYRDVRVPTVSDHFIATLHFRKRRLYYFGLVSERAMLRMSNSDEEAERRDYQSFRKILVKLHGHPTFSGVTPMRSMGKVDSTYQTTWVTPQRVYTLQLGHLTGVGYVGSQLGGQ